MRGITAGLVLGLMLVALANAEEPPEPLTPEEAAFRVLEAQRAGATAVLAALAANEQPDPWLVADELCIRGEHDAASAFAQAAPRKDVERLPAYVESRRGQAQAPDEKTRQAVAAANEALRANDAPAVLAAADAAHRIGWLVRASAALQEAGVSAWHRADRPAALAAFERRLALDEIRGDRRGLAATLSALGNLHLDLGTTEKALGYQLRALKLMRALDNRVGAAGTLVNLGMIHHALAQYDEALEVLEEALGAVRAIRHRPWEAAALGTTGNVHFSLGNYPEALEYQRQALEIHEALRNRPGVAATLGNIGLNHQFLGDYAKALEFQQRRLEIERTLGNGVGVAQTLVNIGIVHESLAQYEKALETQQRALAEAEAAGHQPSIASALGNIGNVYLRLGRLTQALATLRRALKLMWAIGDRAAATGVLVNMGIIHESTGAYGKALEYSEKGLEEARTIGHRQWEANALASLGNIHGRLGEYEKALEYHRRGLREAEALGLRQAVATAVGNLGVVCEALGDYEQALAHQQRALRMNEEMGDLAGVAATLGNLGSIHRERGEHAKAVEYHDRQLQQAEAIGHGLWTVNALVNLASAYLQLGEIEQGARAARDAVAKLPLLVGGLAEQQGATARDQWAALLAIGVRAGIRLESAEVASFFVETGRAGTLLESLGGRDALHDVDLPEELRHAEQAARAVLREAQAALGRAHTAGKRKGVREAGADLEAAQRGMLDVVARIQRTAKAAADVSYPQAASLKAIRAALAPHEALVSFAVLEDESVALVVTRERARLVELGLLDVPLRLDDPDVPSREAVARLRQAIIEPLGLGGRTERLLVSPAGALSYVPFCVLAPEHEVVYVPSGTTYTVLLGERASEAGFTGALRERERWRAVHLACHGLVEAERPQLSSLALTPDESNDGFLTVLEVFRTRIPADLVVLSACETGRGKVHRAEGIVGFTRAFMYAGAPRVICSLWKVDDEATRALMARFYELWNPKDEAEGLPAATALKKAQAYVARDERWSHPYYWAAWQLWGLPE